MMGDVALTVVSAEFGAGVGLYEDRYCCLHAGIQVGCGVWRVVRACNVVGFLLLFLFCKSFERPVFVCVHISWLVG